MSADPLDEVTGSISDGHQVDWELAEASTLDPQELRVLRDIEKVARGYRALHESAAPGIGAEGDAEKGPRRWGDLGLLELSRSGASGEVWRAWDPWLQRDVALKFLQVNRDSGAGDLALLDEARALARVRHSGVVAVHGIAQHDGRLGMWMEFLQGSTLAAEIERRGALPPLEVAEIGLALCRALEAVEKAGVVHRDIKPSNVLIESAGRVVLTDFGLGRRWELADRAWGASGTPIFMSPGVLAGEPATPRTDIYALGVTLRWALTGHPPFKARTLEELRAEAKSGPAVSLSSERPDAPPRLIAVIDRAMAPSAEARYAGASQMAEELEPVVRRAKGDPRRIGRVMGMGASLLIALGIAALAASRWLSPRAPVAAIRFSVSAPPGTAFDPDPMSATVSPDGLTLAFAATDSNRSTRIWVRPLRSLTARPLEGTEGVSGIFWSPDSRGMVYFCEGKLKKVSLTGGPPEVLCAAPDGRGAAWGKNGVIVFAPLPTGPLSRVSAQGGPVSMVARPDTLRHETALRWPQFLPDGKHFLYVSLPPRQGGLDVFVSSLDSDQRTLVLRSDATPVVAGDYIILARDGRLMAQRFDFERLRVVGDPIALGPSTAGDISVGEPLACASMNGVLVQQYAPLANTQLVWLDRTGRELGMVRIPEGRYEKMQFSPDGRRIAIVRRTSPFAVDLWAIDWARGLETRLTSRSQPRIGGMPAWSPDGHRVAFSSNRDGPTNVYAKDVDQGAPERLLYQSSSQFKEVDDWSPDGRYILFEQADPATAWDIWLLPVGGGGSPVPYLRSSFNEFPLEVSPDGKWLAYWSDESGRPQVYVQSFPHPGEKHVIADMTAAAAQWSTDGRELLVYGADLTAWSVPIVTTSSFHAGTPKRLFKYRSDQLCIRGTPDLRRFLMCIPVRDATASTITVEMNWPAEAIAPGR